MKVYIVTNWWHWDGDWRIESVHAASSDAHARASELMAARSEFDRKNGEEYGVEEWAVQGA